MTKSQKRSLKRIIVAAIGYIIAIIINRQGLLTGYWQLLVYLPIYLIIGYDILIKAGKGIVNRQVFDENFLMAIATVGAFIIGEYPEAVAVMLFYQVGQLFESYAVGRSRDSISDLMDIYPEYANIQVDGKLVQVDPEEVQVGDEIVVTAGERIPLDGVVISGSSLVDTSALSGESVPRSIREGDDAISGTINLNSVLTIKVTKAFTDGTVSQILDLVENASSRKAQVENFITKFARYYTPVVVISALVLAVVPPLIIPGATFATWVYRALTFLVISCPCALVISVPLSFFGGIGAASRQGVLVKGSNYLEVLADTRTIVMDKTGTLTHGVFEVVDIAPAAGVTKEELLELTAYAESFSNHPISHSLKKAYGKDIDNSQVSDFEDIAGHGIKANVMGKQVYAGNTTLMDKINVEYIAPSTFGTDVHVVADGKYLGNIIIADTIKENAKDTIESMKKRGITTIMLTGDTNEVGQKVGAELGLDKVYTQLLPNDKVEILEKIINEQMEKDSKHKVAAVGDGINDAPLLSRADVGISMGALGSDAAIEASDIVLMDDDISKLLTASNIARKTLRIVRQNIVFALGVKFIVLALGALGQATMWQAVFADVGVSVIAILNSMRALRTK